MIKLKALKSTNYSFERLSMGFFVFAYGFMAFSIFYYYTSRNIELNNNKKDIQINVIDPSEATDSNLTQLNQVNTLLKDKTTSNNPNVNDEQTRNDIMKTIGRDSTGVTYVVVNKKGLMNTNNVQIILGDTVVFMNSAGEPIDIQGAGGWGSSKINDESTFAQQFFIPKKFDFTIKPFNTSGVIEVVLPSDVTE